MRTGTEVEFFMEIVTGQTKIATLPGGRVCQHFLLVMLMP